MASFRSIALPFLISTLISALSPAAKATELDDIRQQAISSRTTFEELATALTGSPIVWADDKQVRYQQTGGTGETSEWKQAELPPALKAEVTGKMKALKVEAVAINRQRVNLVMAAAGIAPSGTAAGVIIAPADQLGCDSVRTPVLATERGLHCESLGGDMYLYSQR